MADITQTKRGKRRKAPNLSESLRLFCLRTIYQLAKFSDGYCSRHGYLIVKIRTGVFNKYWTEKLIKKSRTNYKNAIAYWTECVYRKLSLLNFLLQIVCKRARTKISGKWPRLSNSRQNIWFRIFSIIPEWYISLHLKQSFND